MLAYITKKMNYMKICFPVKIILPTLILAFVVGLSGCASIMSGSTQRIKISSSPDNANVVIYDMHNTKVWDSTTPATARLKKGDGYFKGALYRVEISKEGYEKQVIHACLRHATIYNKEG